MNGEENRDVKRNGMGRFYFVLGLCVCVCVCVCVTDE